MIKNNNMKLVPSDKIDLRYRDDIALRIYCLMHNNFDPYKKYMESVDKMKEGAEIKKIKSCYKWLKSGKKLPPIQILLQDERMYPLEGAKRLSCSYMLELPIPVTIVPNTKAHKLRLTRPNKISDWRFATVPQNIKDILSLRKKVLAKTEEIVGKRFDKLGLCYHSIPELAIIGGRNCRKRSTIFGLDNLSGKRVLDIGCNMGMMSLECSKKALSVDGVEPSRAYYEIAEMLRKFYKRNNVAFHHTTFLNYLKSSDRKYNVILALAVANWVGQKERVFLKTAFDMLEHGGMLLYESHRNFDKNRFVTNAKRAGFVLSKIGDVDRRNFFVCRKNA